MLNINNYSLDFNIINKILVVIYKNRQLPIVIDKFYLRKLVVLINIKPSFREIDRVLGSNQIYQPPPYYPIFDGQFNVKN